MKKVTIKEIKRFLKTLEENRYRKLVHADARRIAWFVNNSLSEDYDTMPESMRKKWVKAEYKKERYMAKKFLESMKQNESLKEAKYKFKKKFKNKKDAQKFASDSGEAVITKTKDGQWGVSVKESIEAKVRQVIRETIRDLMEGKRIQFIIPIKDRKKTVQILKKTRLKAGQDYDFGAGRGATFILDIEDSYRDKFLELAIINNIGIRS